MHGCGWDSGAARERSSALWLPASPRVTRLAPMAWALRARAPVAAGSLPRATRSAPKAGALRARAPTCAPHVLRTLSPGGEWGCRRRRALRGRCSRGSVQGVLRTPAEGEGGAAHRENFNAARRPRGAFPPPLTTESPTTHYCTVQHHVPYLLLTVPIDPYAERMPRFPPRLHLCHDSAGRERQQCILARGARARMQEAGVPLAHPFLATLCRLTARLPRHRRRHARRRGGAA